MKTLQLKQISSFISFLSPRQQGNYFLLGSLGSAPSLGAPVPEEPINTLLPSGKVMSLPLAMHMGKHNPPLLWYPLTIITVPGTNVVLVIPFLIRVLGVPPSTSQTVFPF